MKKYIIVVLLAIIAIAITSCVKTLEEEGISSTTECIGTVVEKSTNTVLPNIKVKVTDGDHIYAFTTTGPDGAFSLNVDFNEVDETYYLLLDGSPSLPVKQEPLLGIGYKIYDYKILALYDKTDTALRPSVVTGEVSNIMEHSAIASGSVLSCGGRELTDRGICYSTDQLPEITDQHVSAGTEIGEYSCNLTELQSSTRYYYRAYATNDFGTSYGIQKTFTSGNGEATVTISYVRDTTATTVVCGGNVESDGGYQVTDRGLCWSTEQYPKIENSQHLSIGEGIGQFEGQITGLSVNTTYYVRAYATNSTGTVYSEQMPFTTKDGKPEVVTITPTRNGITVTSGGNVISDWGFPVTERGICYSRTPNPDLSDAHSHTSDGSGLGSFSSTFTMAYAGVYYVCAYATNANGTSYGEPLPVNHPYYDLPTFTYGGRTYRVAPPAENVMTWSDANNYCEGLTLYGFTDWRLPTRDEMSQMSQNSGSIGGFNNDYWWTCTSCGGSYHYGVRMLSNVSSCYYDDGSIFYVRPIRIDE